MNTPPAIAIVGLACVYPEARTPAELWDNVLAQRRAFRRLPSERLRAEDYLSTNRRQPDATYVMEAAVIEGYTFDRLKFKVVGSTYRSADLAHWLALDVAAQALADAGFPNGEGLPRENTGVILGNTLTGEFARAGLMRLRWPYVRRTVAAALAEHDWSPEQRGEFLALLEQRYKMPFPEVGEESLAGGLSNTIAGRICNQFNLNGGGFTVDGACASSLLAVANAASALTAGDLDVALAGGVDLSLDPFELVGFAKTGALAPELMRVFDQRSAGFWPGEGCGFAVLMRSEDAVAQGRRIYAVLRGWGISSDGHGGLTRPEADGQLQAVRRAYRRAGYGADTVGYFEGHGTGTSVGDETELQVLTRARRETHSTAPAAAVGSIKANIGHTKAAAGIAGLIKATLAVHEQVLPPTTGCEQPHRELTGAAPALRILRAPEPWPVDVPVRAGVSAMGFGGINAHLTLEGAGADRRPRLSPREQSLGASPQDAELFLFGGRAVPEVRRQIEQVLGCAAQLARSELADVAAALCRELPDADPIRPVSAVRAAVVASTPAELERRLRALKARLEQAMAEGLDFHEGIFLSASPAAPRLGYLFPGQGSPANLGGGLYRRRFAAVRELYAASPLPHDGDGIATDVAQPAIVMATLAGMNVLRELGLTATVGVGHSLGEITALHWAGVYDEAALLRIARARGQAMAQLDGPTGTMAAIAAPAEQVAPMLNGEPVMIVGFNSPRQTVIAGETNAVRAVAARARNRGWHESLLAVSHAFHTPLVRAATPRLAAALAMENLGPVQRRVVSTVSGQPLTPQDDVRGLLCRQVTSPVRFMEAVIQAAPEVDLWIEVGPGQVLSGLAADCQAKPVVAMNAAGASLKGLWQAVGAAFALGAPVQTEALFRGRFTRPFSLNWQPKFFINPCELAPTPDAAPAADTARHGTPQSVTLRRTEGPAATLDDAAALLSPLELVRRLVAERAELPVSAIKNDSRLLNDLHLNSISVGQLVGDAARRLALPPIIGVNEFANASVAQVAAALTELGQNGATAAAPSRSPVPAGVDAWIRPFTLEWVAKPRPGTRPASMLSRADGDWKILAPPDHPWAKKLHQLLAGAGGTGVVVCLPPEPDLARLLQSSTCLDAAGAPVSLLVQGARAVLAAKEHPRFVLVQHGWNAGGFARTLHLEAPHLTTCVVDVPWDHEQSAAWVREEALAADGFVAARYDAAGQRWEPRLKALEVAPEPLDRPLGQTDVLLVTGGGKGITAECAYQLARATGARLALLGRSQPEADDELARNLERLSAANVPFKYCVADVTDAAAVRAAVDAVEHELGRVTALLYGAGANVPRAIGALEEADFRRTLAPKMLGLRNVLAVVGPERLRLCVTFGSIIARAGLPGEADYAVANEWQSWLTGRLAAAYPNCRCLALEWSVWSGLGMGQRLGRVETLAQHGITPIPPDQGAAWLRRLLGQQLPVTSVVVTGRYGDSPALTMEKPELPFRRFVEQPKVFYPGVELIVDAVLSTANDPYVEDHVYQGERLFPAVMGLEAMAQVAQALSGRNDTPVFEDVAFHRPVVVPKQGPVTIRLAALKREGDSVEVTLRCETSDFQTDHFRALCRFGPAADGNLKFQISNLNSSPLETPVLNAPRLPLEPARDLYGALMFHTGRFQRLAGYRMLRAQECLAELRLDAPAAWFGQYLPRALVLGDPGARDAAIHAIQACIPHARVLPVGVGRIMAGDLAAAGNRPLFVHAQEQFHEGDTFHYALEILTEDGRVWERWEDLQLRQMDPVTHRQPWAEPLLAAYAERRLAEWMPDSNVALSLCRESGEDRQGRSQRALAAALGAIPELRWRADGKPEWLRQDQGGGRWPAGAVQVSTAHTGDLTLAVAAAGPLGCDLECVSARPAPSWQDLLGTDRWRLAGLIARETGEDADTAATRVWVARECLKKAGAAVDAPLLLKAAEKDGWVTLASGEMAMLTFVAAVRAAKPRLALGVLRSARAAWPGHDAQRTKKKSTIARPQKIQTVAARAM